MRIKALRFADGSYEWQLVHSALDGTPVVRGTGRCSDVTGCLQAAARVFDAPAHAAHPVQEAGGGWRWVVDDADGIPVAESAAVFTCPAFCGYALYELRRGSVRHSYALAMVMDAR